MLRAVGMGDDDWAKPQVGIASSWNEITPCNLSLGRLAQGAKEKADLEKQAATLEAEIAAEKK